MKKLFTILIIALTFAFSAPTFAVKAENPGHAGPEPQIKVQTFCFKKDGTEASPFDKYTGTGAPNFKNAFIADAMGY